MKKSYSIEVDCANCANVMESMVKKLDGVMGVSVNFILQKMSIEWSDEVDEKALLKAVKKTCKRIDGDFTIEG